LDVTIGPSSACIIPADYKIKTVVARGKQAERVPHQ
jgi:hypothetical protein